MRNRRNHQHRGPTHEPSAPDREMDGAAAAVAAVGIYRNQNAWGWALGLLVAGGALVAYVASRTIGLPGLPAEPDAWFEPMGLAACACEVCFVVLFVFARKSRAIAAASA